VYLLLLLAHTVQNLSLNPSGATPFVPFEASFTPSTLSVVESGAEPMGGGGGGGGGVLVETGMLALARRGSEDIVVLSFRCSICS
jgi:hypothetical protein